MRSQALETEVSDASCTVHFVICVRSTTEFLKNLPEMGVPTVILEDF
jgi:hypothetical protein